MKSRSLSVPSLLIALGVGLSPWMAQIQAEDWPQFRGTNSAGVAPLGTSLPAEIGPEKNVLWKAALPPGHSSPIVVKNKIFVTGVRDKKQLLTMALDRSTGQIIWEQEAPHEELEKIHSIGSFAQSTPAADDERVVSFFGSSGLYCYDHAGKLLWKKAMGPFNNDFGAGSSPIIVGDRVILCQDHDQGSFLAAYDKRTGEQLWHVDRGIDFSRNWCTPVVWNVDGKSQIVLAGTLKVVGYDLETGKTIWTVRGVSRVVCMTPVIGDDQHLYVAGWSAGGDPGERIALDAFDKVAPEYDQDKNGTFEEAELPKGALRQRFTQCDRDKDGKVTRAEYDEFRMLFDQSQNVVLAIAPGGQGDISESHVRWRFSRYVPFCASPLYYQGRVFTVKDGGILTCLDAKTGEPKRTARVSGTGDYFCSPVAGDGKVYLLSQEGKLTVASAEDQWKTLGTGDFGEEAYATPAIADSKLYIRTAGHLYCFGNK
ncbi:outer membrane biogenesis protein BamB [Anatilimnocola aggregata]|uniref:Outer membrane biogenesis protein BamB n=1 Tax=Anatilimnocola aggregata TaxID=2528021 RepID=A0A517YL21_9BACT|nr:PQQ-binding-like beta-propeller repeat protein [Anatilimnocola aggregata]QDU30921.1 outer membrane biogenesis protein BamB [Anatilimnocola aggregata]